MATIFDTMRIQKLTNQWEQKKQNLTKKVQEDERTPEQRQMDSMMEMLKRERDSNQKAQAMSGIDAKIKSGGELTPEEISYLKENDPEKLRDYEEARAERESYKQKLKACKTKEDVARVKMTTLGNFMSQAKSIDSSPYIPKDKKLELMGKLAAKVANCEQAHQAFVKSQAYRDMPSEEEVREEAAEAKAVTTEQYEEMASDKAVDEQATSDDVTPESYDQGTVPFELVPDISDRESGKRGDTVDRPVVFSDVHKEINDFFKRNDNENHRFSVHA